MKTILAHPDSPYIRAIGFLYLRYATNPATLWGWMKPYLYDTEKMKSGASARSAEITIGEFARGLLTDNSYHGTVLPRLPNAREIKVQLLLAEENESRAQAHMRSGAVRQFVEGVEVRALYGDEENPTTWYDAVIQKVETKDEHGEPLGRDRYTVHFPEYENTELVFLGELDVMTRRRGPAVPMEDRHFDEDRRAYPPRGYPELPPRYDGRPPPRGYDRRGGYRHSPPRGRPSRSRSRDRDYERESIPPPSREEELMREVVRRERDAIAARGRAYSQRPATFKTSMASNGPGAPPDIGGRGGGRSGGGRPKLGHGRQATTTDRLIPDAVAALPQRSVEEAAAVEEKRKRLREKYG
mmetsp:Transcript_3268/g.6784  ORF Transcript_3268/g.6784 Transcript_3268/m.6784 type:complete len:355 (+) Transcript_3268:495-1559(+)